MRPEGSPRPARALPWLIATFFGVGRFPFASGTVATLAAVPLYIAGYLAGGDLLVAGLAAFFSIAGVAASGALADSLGYHDPPEAVVDEVAGFLVTMMYLPLSPWTCAAGFVLFRALDVLKPWPASRAERLPRGWGIMADDLICGLAANLIIRAGIYLWR